MIKNKKKIKFNLTLQDEKISKNKILSNLKNNKKIIFNKTVNNLVTYKNFKTNSCISNKTLNKEIRSKEIVVTRRFRPTKVPNKYNLNINKFYTNYL